MLHGNKLQDYIYCMMASKLGIHKYMLIDKAKNYMRHGGFLQSIVLENFSHHVGVWTSVCLLVREDKHPKTLNFTYKALLDLEVLSIFL